MDLPAAGRFLLLSRAAFGRIPLRAARRGIPLAPARRADAVPPPFAGAQAPRPGDIRTVIRFPACCPHGQPQAEVAQPQLRAVAQDGLIAGIGLHAVDLKPVPMQRRHMQPVALHPEEGRPQMHLPVRDAYVAAVRGAQRPFVRDAQLLPLRQAPASSGNDAEHTGAPRRGRIPAHLPPGRPVRRIPPQRQQQDKQGAQGGGIPKGHARHAEPRFVHPVPVPPQPYFRYFNIIPPAAQRRRLSN